MHVCQA